VIFYLAPDIHALNWRAVVSVIAGKIISLSPITSYRQTAENV
jgi:hypothetical protein